MMTADQLCSHITSIINAPIHVYDETGNQVKVYGQGAEQQDVLACDTELKRMLLEKGDSEHPVLHLETQQILYGIVRDTQSVFVLGPCCLDYDTDVAVRYLVEMHKLDSQKTCRIQYTPLFVFTELMIMLFELLTGDTVAREEIYGKLRDWKTEYAVKEKYYEAFQGMRENQNISYPYSQEQRRQKAIRQGDLNALYNSFKDAYAGTLMTLSHDPLRQVKNTCMISIALACRSAIAGGLKPEVAFSMSDAFAQRVEDVRYANEVRALERLAEIEFCTAVHEWTRSGKSHPLISRCKELVFQNLYNKINLQQLAKELDVSPNYLSRLFVQEEGIRLTEYISKQKMEAAKEQLMYTDTPYVKIAIALGFSTQSHFGQIFKKYTGMTPNEYRERYYTK